MNNNTKEIKKIIDKSRNDIFLLHHSLIVLNMLLKYPEDVASNVDLLYGVNDIIENNQSITQKIIDDLDISSKLWE